MRRFDSCGPLSIRTNFYAPRTELKTQVLRQLQGDDPYEGGHYITVWAPRQTGKTWLLMEAAHQIKREQEFEAAYISMEGAKQETTHKGVLEEFHYNLCDAFERRFPVVKEWKQCYLRYIQKLTYYSRKCL